MKEYLKMADVFALPINDDDRKSAVGVCSSMVGVPYSADALTQYAAHAINSHDDLVEENERLRKSLLWAVGFLPFEQSYEWSDDENSDAHRDALSALGVEE